MTIMTPKMESSRIRRNIKLQGEDISSPGAELVQQRTKGKDGTIDCDQLPNGCFTKVDPGPVDVTNNNDYAATIDPTHIWVWSGLSRQSEAHTSQDPSFTVAPAQLCSSSVSNIDQETGVQLDGYPSVFDPASRPRRPTESDSWTFASSPSSYADSCAASCFSEPSTQSEVFNMQEGGQWVNILSRHSRSPEGLRQSVGHRHREPFSLCIGGSLICAGIRVRGWMGPETLYTYESPFEEQPEEFNYVWQPNAPESINGTKHCLMSNDEVAPRIVEQVIQYDKSPFIPLRPKRMPDWSMSLNTSNNTGQSKHCSCGCLSDPSSRYELRGPSAGHFSKLAIGTGCTGSPHAVDSYQTMATKTEPSLSCGNNFDEFLVTECQDEKDAFLVKAKRAGMPYKEIKRKGCFTEAESTLRGRFRTLTKEKHHRVRRPEWQEKDIALLKHAVIRCTDHKCVTERKRRSEKTGKLILQSSSIPWKKVAQYIAKEGGSYHFGNATCRKKWDEVSKMEESLRK